MISLLSKAFLGLAQGVSQAAEDDDNAEDGHDQVLIVRGHGFTP